MNLMVFTYFILLPLAVGVVAASIIVIHKKAPNQIGLPVCGAIVLSIAVASLFTLHGIAEEAIISVINSGAMPEKYLTGEGGGFNYATVEGFLIFTLVLTIVYFLLFAAYYMKPREQKSKKRLLRVTCGVLAFYAIMIIRLAILFPQVAMVFFIPASVIVLLTAGNLYGVYQKDCRAA